MSDSIRQNLICLLHFLTFLSLIDFSHSSPSYRSLYSLVSRSHSCSLSFPFLAAFSSSLVTLSSRFLSHCWRFLFALHLGLLSSMLFSLPSALLFSLSLSPLSSLAAQKHIPSLALRRRREQHRL